MQSRSWDLKIGGMEHASKHIAFFFVVVVFTLQVWFSPVVSVWSVPHTHSTTTTAFACIFQCFFCQQVQQSCNSSSASPDTSEEPCPTDMVKMTKSKTFQAYLPSCHRTYSCIHCRAHLANHDELISKSFQGSQGRAYLFNSVVNVGCGPAEERVLLTGLHAVADIYCENCKTTLGWKYEHAFESSQKYKEGKFIIELAHMIKDNGWEWRSGWAPSFSDLGMLFIELRGVSNHRPPCPAPTAPTPPNPTSPSHPTSLSSTNLAPTPTRTSFTCTHPPAHREPEQNKWVAKMATARRKWSDCRKITSQESCRYFKDCVFSFAAPGTWVLTPGHTLPRPSPPPPNHAYKWLWWYGDHYAKGDRLSLFCFVFFLYFWFRPSSETNDFDDFGYF